MVGREGMGRWIAGLCMALLVQGCAHEAVRCDGRLEPINPPVTMGMAGSDSDVADRQARDDRGPSR